MQDLLWLRQTPIAHRGLHRGAHVPENSLAAFARAVEARVPIELDVRLTADGRVVVFHDYSLKRMTGRDARLSDTRWDELSKVRLAGSDQGIPLLADVLALVAGRVGLLIELKNEGAVGDLEASVASLLDAYDGPVAVQAFNPLTVAWFAKHRPVLPRGQLAGKFPDRPDIKGIKKYLLKNMCLNFLSRPSFISYDIRGSDHDFFESLKHKLSDKPILLWLIDTAPKQTFCRRLGFNYIFEHISIS